MHCARAARTHPLAVALWGAEITGLAPSPLRALRNRVFRAVVRLPLRAEPSLAVIASGIGDMSDPALTLH
eukprot:4576849-Amphidinium_carterae.1